jgi:hypothetical protein
MGKIMRRKKDDRRFNIQAYNIYIYIPNEISDLRPPEHVSRAEEATANSQRNAFQALPNAFNVIRA